MYISNPNGRRRASSPQNKPTDRSINERNTQDSRTPPSPFSPFTPRPVTPSPAPVPPTAPQNIPPTPAPQSPSPNTGMGYVIVRVTTASGAIPLEGALVTVTEFNTGSGGDILYALKTNSSGLTPKVSLPAPPRSASLSPGNGRSYSTYNIQVASEGYNMQQYINVPIFDGITAVQNADMVPLPENGETDRANPYNPGIFYESEAPRLDTSSRNN